MDNNENEEIKKKIEPPKIVLKAPKPAPKFTGGYRSGQNNFPYSVFLSLSSYAFFSL